MNMIFIKAENQDAIINADNIRCIIHDKEKKTVKVLYTDNTTSGFKDVKEMIIKEENKTKQ